MEIELEIDRQVALRHDPGGKKRMNSNPDVRGFGAVEFFLTRSFSQNNSQLVKFTKIRKNSKSCKNNEKCIRNCKNIEKIA